MSEQNAQWDSAVVVVQQGVQVGGTTGPHQHSGRGEGEKWTRLENV